MKLIIALALLSTSLTANAEDWKYRHCRDTTDSVESLVAFRASYNPSTATPEATELYKQIADKMTTSKYVGATIIAYETALHRKWTHGFEACLNSF